MIKTVVVVYYEQDSEKQAAKEKAATISNTAPEFEVCVQKIANLDHIGHVYYRVNYNLNEHCLSNVLRFELPKGSYEIISVATCNRLAEVGINSVEQLTQLTKADLKAIPGLGKKGVSEVEALFKFIKVDLLEIRKF